MARRGDLCLWRVSNPHGQGNHPPGLLCAAPSPATVMESPLFLVCRMKVRKYRLAESPPNDAQLPKLQREFKQNFKSTVCNGANDCSAKIDFISLVLAQAPSSPSWPATQLSDQGGKALALGFITSVFYK